MTGLAADSFLSFLISLFFCLLGTVEVRMISNVLHDQMVFFHRNFNNCGCICFLVRNFMDPD